MPVQKSHSRLRPQVVRPDELPKFIPDPSPVPAGPTERGKDGRFVKGNRVCQKGGQARMQVASYLRSLGLEWLAGEPKAAELRNRGIRQLRAEQTWLCSTVGGGILDPLAASELRSAATKQVLADLLLEAPKLIGDTPAASVALASRLLSDARNHRLTAVELAARGAAARHGSGNGTPRAAFNSIDVSGELRELQKLLGDGKPQPVTPVVTSGTDEGEGDEQ